MYKRLPMEVRDWVCLQCRHCEMQEIGGEYQYNAHDFKVYVPPSIAYFCWHYVRYVRKVSRTCSRYFPVTQSFLKGGGNNMVKVDELDVEKERMDLAALPQECELIAVEEATVEASAGKTGGLLITYKNRAGKTFPQKYSPVSATVLAEAMRKLKLDDTAQLQKDWYLYKLTVMRLGFPRMIPQKKVSK